MGLLSVSAISAMDMEKIKYYTSIQHDLDTHLPKELRQMIVVHLLKNDIKEAQKLLKKMRPFMGDNDIYELIELPSHQNMISQICCLDEKSKEGLKFLLRSNNGKCLPSKLSSEQFEQIKSISPDLLRESSPYLTAKHFSEAYYKVPVEVSHQEERSDGLRRIACTPLLTGCFGSVMALPFFLGLVLEGKNAISKNNAMNAMIALTAAVQVSAVADFLEMEWKYNISSEKPLPVYEKRVYPPSILSKRSAGTDFKKYINSQEYKDRQRLATLIE